ncbi:MAG: hypothetical protein AAFU65_07495 [Pseudomonadota bacterium]
MSLSVGSNAITSAMIANGNVTAADMAANAVGTGAIADNSVTTADIQNGTIQTEDLDEFETFSVRGLTIDGGSFTIDSAFDIFINDSFNGFRWYDTAGTNQLGSITVRESEMVMTHNGQSNQIFRSTSSGVGFAGANPTAGYAATVPSLNVTGTTNIGYQIVSQVYPIDVMVTACASHGGDTCYTGTAAVACPSGKRALGGGSTGGNPRFGSLGYSYPSGNTSWQCSSSYDIGGASRTCYVICADVE